MPKIPTYSIEKCQLEDVRDAARNAATLYSAFRAYNGGFLPGSSTEGMLCHMIILLQAEKERYRSELIRLAKERGYPYSSSE